MGIEEGSGVPPRRCSPLNGKAFENRSRFNLPKVRGYGEFLGSCAKVGCDWVVAAALGVCFYGNLWVCVCEDDSVGV